MKQEIKVVRTNYVCEFESESIELLEAGYKLISAATDAQIDRYETVYAFVGIFVKEIEND